MSSPAAVAGHVEYEPADGGLVLAHPLAHDDKAAGGGTPSNCNETSPME